MADINFNIRGNEPPFNGYLLTGSSVVIDSFSGMTASGATGFTNVGNAVSYIVRVEDNILHVVESGYTPTTTTTTTSTTSTSTSTTTSTSTSTTTSTTTSLPIINFAWVGGSSDPSSTGNLTQRNYYWNLSADTSLSAGQSVQLTLDYFLENTGGVIPDHEANFDISSGATSGFIPTSGNGDILFVNKINDGFSSGTTVFTITDTVENIRTLLSVSVSTGDPTSSEIQITNLVAVGTGVIIGTVPSTHPAVMVEVL